ncbi:MAG: hypothetical protein AAGJ58_21900, partial [Pseudomonadota bacterium]
MRTVKHSFDESRRTCTHSPARQTESIIKLSHTPIPKQKKNFFNGRPVQSRNAPLFFFFRAGETLTALIPE